MTHCLPDRQPSAAGEQLLHHALLDRAGLIEARSQSLNLAIASSQHVSDCALAPRSEASTQYQASQVALV